MKIISRTGFDLLEYEGIFNRDADVESLVFSGTKYNKFIDNYNDENSYWGFPGLILETMYGYCDTPMFD